MPREKIFDEAWVMAQARVIVIGLGVQSEYFEQYKVQALAILNNKVTDAMTVYRRQTSSAFTYQLNRAGFFGYSSVKTRWELIYKNKHLELKSFAEKAINSIFEELEKSAVVENSAYWSLQPKEHWKPLVTRPQAPTAAMTPVEAEHFIVQLMLYLGAKGSTLTQYSQDGGVDCESEIFVAQVKHHNKPIGVSAVREIFAVGVSKSKVPIVFSKSGFTQGAIKFAIENQILLYSYLPLLKGETLMSNVMLEHGMEGPPPKVDQQNIEFEKSMAFRKW